MPYEMTATRKRPKTFGDLAGQDFVSATLKASIESGRIAHAYLFSGPRGCGKTSTARILARALNCEQGPSAEPCGVCDSCQSIARGASLDVIEIDGASNTSVENIRQIKDEVLFPPNSSKYKIYIIDEVHMLSNSAFNALLKTIEEPPPYIVFMFATTELHKVPATIRSRCQQFNFRLIPLEILVERLRIAASDLGLEADDDALLWIATEATGSLRDAYTLFDQVAAFSRGRISVATIREKLGLTGTESMAELFGYCAQGDRTKALELLDSIVMSGVSVDQFVVDAIAYVRSLLLVAAGVTREGLIGAKLSAFPQATRDAVDAPKLEAALTSLFDLYRNLRYSANPRWEIELTVSRLCSIRDYLPAAELLRVIRALKGAIASGKAPGAPRLGAALEAALGNSPGVASSSSGGDESGSAPAGSPAAVSSAPFASAPTGPGLNADVGESSEAHARGRAEGGVKVESTLPESAAPGTADELAALKAAVLSSLGRGRVVLSACFERTGPWSIEGASLVIPCANGYDAGAILAEAGLIAKKVLDAYGRPLKIEPRAAERKPEERIEPVDEADDEAEPSDPVAIVERVFRGKRVPGNQSETEPGRPPNDDAEF